MKIKKIRINETDYEIDGKSAYEVAVDKGFEGTEEEWLASLKGAPGEVEDLPSAVYTASANLYDASQQTDDTVAPHYYVNGVPSTSTQFDATYHCTAPIPVRPNTTYTLGLVPAFNTLTLPWPDALTQCVFFYDDDGAYIGKASTATFITPANTASLRFNYAHAAMGRVQMNRRCMLVEGVELPETFEPYFVQTLEGRIAETEAKISSPPLYFTISGSKIVVVSKYDATHDLAVTLEKKGGNNLFDFSLMGLIENATRTVSKDVASQVSLLSTPGDWHAPFKIKAKNNIDGDQPTKDYFTGGNHQYNNTGTGSTATARCESVRFFVDGQEIANGDGYAHFIEMRWTNYVQAQNTTKADGSGREVLQENHVLTFDGHTWTTHVELVPLEDVTIALWYGLQAFTTKCPMINYVGGANRGTFDTRTASSTCGDSTTNEMVLTGDAHQRIVSIDGGYDLGRSGVYSGTQRAFAHTYGKCYFTVLQNYAASQGCKYYLRGAYRFTTI